MNEKINAWIQSATEFLNGQVWFQQLRGKWDELDSQARNGVKLGAFAGTLLIILFFLLSSIWSVHSLKSELSQKRELLGVIQSSTDEMRNLRDISSAPAAAALKATGDWSTYFEGLLGNTGLEKSNFSISSEKPGESTEQFKETLFDVSLKKVNVKQLVRFTFAVQNGARPVKVRNLSVHAQDDFSGYLDANLAVSGFTLIPSKEK